MSTIVNGPNIKDNNNIVALSIAISSGVIHSQIIVMCVCLRVSNIENVLSTVVIIHHS